MRRSPAAVLVGALVLVVAPAGASMAGCGTRSNHAAKADAGPSASGSGDSGPSGPADGGLSMPSLHDGGDAAIASPPVDSGGLDSMASDVGTSPGAAPAAEAGCPGGSLAPGDYTQTLPADADAGDDGGDGGARTYYLHVPTGLDPSSPAPMVVAFHGGGQTAQAFEGFAHLKAKSDSSGFVLAEPEGTGALGGLSAGTLDVWNAGNCCEYAEQKNANIDDVGFVRAMLDAIAQQVCIDPKRIFATGFSNGGMLSHRLACQASDRFAAIAAVSGGMGNHDLDVQPSATLFPCTPGRPVPVLHVHGSQDACYPFDGGYGPLSAVTFEAVQVTIDDWVARNGCSANPTLVSANGLAACRLYPCPKPGEVELCVIDGGGHYWPGGDDWSGSEVVCGTNQGVRSSDLNANDAIWSWFVAHPMP